MRNRPAVPANATSPPSAARSKSSTGSSPPVRSPAGHRVSIAVSSGAETASNNSGPVANAAIEMKVEPGSPTSPQEPPNERILLLSAQQTPPVVAVEASLPLPG